MAILTLDAKTVRPLFGSITSSKQMGEASSVKKIVFVGPDSLLYEAAGDDNNHATGQLGMIVSGGRATTDGTVQAGEQVDVLWFGRVELGTTLDETKQYYLANETSSVKGLIGDVAGTVTRRLGKPESSRVFFFNPQDVATAYT